MQKVLTAEEMREVDRLTTEKYGIPSMLLMENAAHAAAQIIKEKLGGKVNGKSVIIVCGKGNNGGDGAALGRILSTMGFEVRVDLFAGIDETSGDAGCNFRSLDAMGNAGLLDFTADVSIDDWISTIGTRLREFDFLVDALFGTGLTRPLDDSYIPLTRIRNYLDSSEKPKLLSIDLPSGLDSDSSNSIGENFESDITITFTAPKLANVLSPSANLGGELHVADIGSPRELIDRAPSKTFVSEREDIRHWFDQTRFSSDSYKKKRGSALLVVGSRKYSGAAVLAGNGAIRSGAGLITVAVPESALSAVSERIAPEVIVRSLNETQEGCAGEESYDQIMDLVRDADAMAIGSGLGSSDGSTRILVRKLIESRTCPMVLDADGLNAVAPFESKFSSGEPVILTPHEGEFRRLLGLDERSEFRDRIKSVRQFAEAHGVILVLKGEQTLVANPSGVVVINSTGNSGVGKAGNGDNLAGIITGFVAQAAKFEVGVFDAVVAAVYTAGVSADLAETRFGKRVMLASDVRECLADAIRLIGGKSE